MMSSRKHSVSSTSSQHSAASSVFSHGSSSSTSTRISAPDVDIAQFAAAGHLPCEFVGYGGCDMVFSLDDYEGWIEHIIQDHLQDNLPRKVVCWFCDQFDFDSRRTSDRRQNFDQRMYHIRDHFLNERRTIHDIRPDHHLNTHLHNSGLIQDEVYHSVRRWDEVPQPSWILPHDGVPPGWYERESREQIEYSNPHDEERRHRRHHQHRSGRSRR
ncbi:hypothetical protein GGR58DRAFT_338920 [Xylaria digitata]|nr:hypothetical protein GGR58DRAFT_338920 [Xylaria digitata]